MDEYSHNNTTHKCSLVIGLLLLSACVAPTSNLPTASYADTQAEAHKQLVVVIRERDKQARRLARIAGPILAANTDQCGSDIRNLAGVFFTTAVLTESIVARRATIEARGLSRPGEVKVAYTYPGFPGENLVKPGEVVTAINGVNAYSAVAGLARPNMNLPTLKIRVIRDGQNTDVVIPTIPLCDYKVMLVNRDAVNAFAGGGRITFTTGFMRLVDEDRDLALIFGHEMAHLTRKHIEAAQTNELVGKLVGVVVSGLIGVDVTEVAGRIGRESFSQEFESEADYVGMYHASRAGWDMSGAANFFRLVAAAHPGSMHSAGSSHPSTITRAVMVEQTALEIASKRNEQLALIPNFKDQPPSRVPLADLQQAGVPTGIAKAPDISAFAAAQAGDAEQHYRRGIRFEDGIDGPRDYAQAAIAYRKAADLKHRSALYNLAMMYTAGHGVRQNNSQAVIFFRQAAELKHAKAHFNMGIMLENGRGTAKNPGQALTSYIIASNLGLGEIANDARSRTASHLTTAQVSEAERRADQWMRDHRY